MKLRAYILLPFSGMLFAAGLFFITARGASAATVYTNYSTGNDTSGTGSAGSPYKTFHKAYTVASSGDTINLTDTFTWTNADETGDIQYNGYEISKNLTITGQSAAATIVQAASNSTTGTRRVFTIKNGYTVTLQNVKVRYGRNATDYNGREGGGILVETGATLTVADAHITQNYVNSTSWGGFGGGIENLGTLTVNRSTIDNNFAQSQGGGVNNAYVAAGTNISYITNSTIAFNSTADTVATVGGAGLYVRSGTMYVTNATVAYNDAPSGTGDTTGIDVVSGSTLSIKNSIVAANKVGGSPVTAASGNWFDITNSGTLTDGGGNIFGKVNTAFSGVSFHSTTWYDLYGNGAGDNVYRLQASAGTTGSLYLDTALADNSTLNNTQTLAITNASSITINNGQSGSNGSVSVPSVDGRNLSRVSTVDIGAFEYGATSNSNPSMPSALGASGMVNGSRGSDSTPDFTFTLSDADGSDTVKFQIQIDDSSNFGSPVVDYTSALAVQGSATFTVGQAVGSGTYTTGSSGQTLVDGSYYWRVKAIDSSTAESSYATANSGSVAFIVDTTGPAAVTGFSALATGSTVALSWTNPVDSDFSSITIRRSTSSYPASIVSGTGVASGLTGTSRSDAALADGTYYYSVFAFDTTGNISSPGQVTVTVDTVAPIISTISVTPATTSATITWTTDTVASSQVDYGLTTSYGTSTAVTDTSPRVLNHSVSVTDLTECTTYYVRVVSIDAASNSTTGYPSSAFTTAGCTGNATVLVAGSDGFNSLSLGGSINVNGVHIIEIPTGFVTGNVTAVFQLHTLNDAEFFATAGIPSGKNRVGSMAVNLKAFTGTNTSLTNFDTNIGVSLPYQAADVQGLDENTLLIYRYHGGSWSVLSNCTTNKTTRVVSCETSAFSDFAIFGTATSASASASNSGGGAALPAVAFSKPRAPIGGFKISIAEGSKVKSPAVNLSFVVGADVQKVALSNNSNFTASGIEPLVPIKPWNLCWSSGAAQAPSVCPAGTYTVYAQFYTSWGQVSEVVSTTVTYDPLGVASVPNSTKLVSNDLVLDGKTIYLIMHNKKHGFSSMDVFTGLGYSLKNIKKASTADTAQGETISSKTNGHIAGSWVLSNKTVYFVAEQGLVPVPHWDVFLTNGGKASSLVKANKYDTAKPLLDIMGARDS